MTVESTADRLIYKPLLQATTPVGNLVPSGISTGISTSVLGGELGFVRGMLANNPVVPHVTEPKFSLNFDPPPTSSAISDLIAATGPASRPIVTGGGGAPTNPLSAATQILWGATKMGGKLVYNELRHDQRIRHQRDNAPLPPYLTLEQMDKGFQLPKSGYKPS
jgi:hypothetical protein